MNYGSKSKSQAKPKEPQRSPRILGIGLIKLDFYMNLTDDLIKKFNLDFSKLNSPKDLAFIAEDPVLLDMIQISSSDTLSNILLYLNKANVQKSFVELITLSPLRIHPEEEHMKKIFTHVTEHNYLFSNEMSVTGVPNKISFAFKNGKKLLKYFDIITDYDPYTDDLLNEDHKQSDEKLNNLYERINASINKNLNEIKEVEHYKKNIENKIENIKNYEDDDILVRDEIYNNISQNLEYSRNENFNKNLINNDNNKINEVHEEETNSNYNLSEKNTQSKKSNNNKENIENISKRNDEEVNISQRENIEKSEQMNISQNTGNNKSKLTNKTKSKNENQSNIYENQNENEENINNVFNEGELDKNENLSKIEKSRILKTNSDKNIFSDTNFKKNDDLEDFKMEDLEEIKDGNFADSLNLKTQSKKKESTVVSQMGDLDEQNDNAKSKKSSHLFQEPYEKKSVKYTTENNLINKIENKKTSSKKLDSLNKSNEIKKGNRPLYEDIDKFNFSGKLENIPAACEIEEYDFLFIDLEEFINFHSNGFHLSALAEFMKKISLNEKKPRIVLNYPNILINLNVVNLQLLETIMTIMSYTDIFLFEKKECLAFFNMLNQMNYEKDLNEKQLMDYFFKEIPHFKNSVNKLGLFLDDLQRFYVAEQKKDKVINNLNYEINLHPKINHFNQKIIDEYKKIMTINNSYFKSIFFGGYFSNYIFNEDHYTSYFSGAESTKRILEIFKNKIDFPTNPEFYLIKLQKQKFLKDQQKEKLKQKEEKFVLDCINKTNSSIKYYNPLFDDNLNAFFASSIIRKQLKDKGFINTNGFVLYDSSYKSLIGASPKTKKRLDTSERERHLLLAIKQNRDLLSTDLQSFSKSLKDQSPTHRKLPLPSFDLNSSNLYISSKLKNLKVSRKKLKPIYNTKTSNSKINVKNTDNKASTNISPKGKKDISIYKQNNSSNNDFNHQNNQNKTKRTSINNNSLELLNISLLKEQEDNYNYKEKSKISSTHESILDGNSVDNDILKSKNKSKTFTVSMGNNRYTENSKSHEFEQSKNIQNNSQINKEFNNSKKTNNKNFSKLQEQENDNNKYEEKEEDKDIQQNHISQNLNNEEKLEASNTEIVINNNEDMQENKAEDLERQDQNNTPDLNEDRGVDEENKNEFVGEKEEEEKEKVEKEMDIERKEEVNDNNFENIEENMDINQEENKNNDEENVNNEEENNQRNNKEEDNIEAEGEN